MLEKLRLRAASLGAHLREIPKAEVIICAALLCAGLAIRIFTKEACPPLGSYAHRGLFPPVFIYALFHAVRLLCAGTLLYCAIFLPCAASRVKAVICAAALCVFLMLEYKLIYGMMWLLLAEIICIAAAAAAFMTVMFIKAGRRSLSIAALLLIVLQAVLFVQLISLIICL